MSYDLNADGKTLLIDLINKTNNTLFTTENLILGTPTPIEAPAGHSEINTSIVVTGDGTTTFVGPQTLYYTRLDLARLFANRNVDFEHSIDSGVTEVPFMDLVDQLNMRFNLALSGDDLIDTGPIPYTEGQPPLDIQLQAKSGSFTYIGQTVVTVSFTTAPESYHP